MHYTIEGLRVLRCNITDVIIHDLVMIEKYVYGTAVAHIRLLDGVAQAGLAIEALVWFSWHFQLHTSTGQPVRRVHGLQAIPRMQ
jgi:hypothetical protein